jgi:protein tyrosine/serine phosphatase
MTDPEAQPVFVHCMHGEDRTGIVLAVYRMDVDGWSNAEAEAEMQAFGFNDVWRDLKKFVRTYPAPAAPGSR